MRSWTLTTGHLALVVLCSVVLGGQLVMFAWALATGHGTKAIGPAVVVAAMALVLYSLLRAARRAEEPRA